MSARKRSSQAAIVGLAFALIAAALFSGGLAGTQKITALNVQRILLTSGEPSGIALDAQRGRAYVTDSKENVLFVFDLSTGTALAHIPTGLQPAQVVLGSGRAYVSNFGDHSVTVIDTTADRAIKTFSVGALGLALDDAAHQLYIASGSSIQVLDITSDHLVATIEAPVGANVWGLALDPLTHRLFATDITNPRVLVYDARTRVNVAIVAIDAPARFGISARGGRVAVASFAETGTVTLIDAATATLLSRGAAGRFAASVVLDAAGVAYVASAPDRQVTALDATGRTLSRADLAQGPAALALDPLSGNVIAATKGGAPPPARAFPDPVQVVRP